MVDVHVITKGNRHLYERELDEHHQIRHRIYIEELRWRGLTPRADLREYDQFDIPEAVYLLGIDKGRVVGGLRLLPTTGSHLIADVFSRFASERGVPRQIDIAEWTRIFVVPERREEHGGSKVGSTVIASMIEYALQEGLSGISVFMNTFWLPKFLKYGWRVRPLGMPDVHDDEWLIAVLIDVTPQALAGIRSACGLEHRSALVRQGMVTPFIPGRVNVPAVA
ncbi:MAG TPA: acyl-homoserine-lactone synthase [Xanthobacteraceae bacterium]|jgi:acyl-homoserine lactone synthase|nr:acyl-homoserine-lactone synthase [Xanthobacteraceae bacterium]